MSIVHDYNHFSLFRVCVKNWFFLETPHDDGFLVPLFGPLILGSMLLASPFLKVSFSSLGVLYWASAYLGSILVIITP